jgi:hypothetical protein
MSIRRYTLLVALFFLLLSTACQRNPIASTPEEAVFRAAYPDIDISSFNPNSTPFQILGTRPYPNGGQIMFFRSVQEITIDGRKQRPEERIGYSVVMPFENGWSASSIDTYAFNVNGINSQTVVSAAAVTDASHRSPSMAIGVINNSSVTAVEVTFANGQTLRDDGKGGFFAVVMQGSLPCTLRALDAQNNVLYEHDYGEMISPPPCGP